MSRHSTLSKAVADLRGDKGCKCSGCSAGGEQRCWLSLPAPCHWEGVWNCSKKQLLRLLAMEAVSWRDLAQLQRAAHCSEKGQASLWSGAPGHSEKWLLRQLLGVTRHTAMGLLPLFGGADGLSELHEVAGSGQHLLGGDPWGCIHGRWPPPPRIAPAPRNQSC